MNLSFFTGSTFRATIPLAAFETRFPGCTLERWTVRIWRSTASEAPPIFAWDTAAPPAAFPNGSAEKIIGPALLLKVSSQEMLANFGPAAGAYVFDIGFYRASAPKDFVRVDGGSAKCLAIDDAMDGTPAAPGDTVIVSGANSFGAG